MERIPPKEMATKLARQLRSQQPDYQYLKQVGSAKQVMLFENCSDR
jgi:hypothetical protein